MSMTAITKPLDVVLPPHLAPRLPPPPPTFPHTTIVIANPESSTPPPEDKTPEKTGTCTHCKVRFVSHVLVWV